MNQDQQTYTRATHAALLGLIAQLTFAVVMAGLGLYAKSSALHAATWHLFGGLPIWVALWMLYNQHRLERAEALEAEQLSQQDARAAALFDEAGHQLAQARKRLDGFYRWGLNVVSITVAVYLIAAGGALLWGNYQLIDQADGENEYTRLFVAALGNPAANPWMVVGFSFLMAFLGFLAARYLAGMTRLRAWQMLRGGAAYLIGNVLVIVLVGVAALMLGVFNLLWPLAVLSLVIPALMILLGCETMLAFVLGIYRPRKADEIVRPAFDSRLLGWLTSPESFGKIVSETLNYQFGFEITKTWFYVLLGRALAPLLILATLILLGLSCVVIVQPNQQAVVTDRGRLVRIADPGISLKLPWPLARAEKFDVSVSRQLVIGTYDESQRVAGRATLWTNDHVEGKVTYLPTAPTQIDDPSIRRGIEEDVSGVEGQDPATIESDASAAVPQGTSRLGGLISMQAVISYEIEDLAQYASADSAERPDRLLEALAEERLSRVILTRSVDDLLGPGRLVASREMLEALRRDVERYGLGLEVLGVLFYDVHPPKEGEVADAFLEQVNALQTQKTEVENAQRDAIGILAGAAGSRREALRIEDAIRKLSELRDQANEAGGEPSESLAAQITQQQAQVNRLIDQAGGQASRTLAAARQERWRVALGEQAEASRFSFEREAYDQAPEYFKARYYLDAVAEAFSKSNRRVITTIPPKEGSTVRLNLEDQGSAADLFTTENN